MAPKHETPIAIAIALAFFVLPVGLGFTLADPPRWVADSEPLNMDGPVPEGVIRISEVHEYGSHADQCMDYTFELTDAQRASLTMEELAGAISFLTDDLSSAPCAERTPYPAEARCVERRQNGRHGFGFDAVTLYFDLDEDDRERCRGQWTELPHE